MLTTSAVGALIVMRPVGDTLSDASSIRAISPPLLFATKSAVCWSDRARRHGLFPTPRISAIGLFAGAGLALSGCTTLTGLFAASRTTNASYLRTLWRQRFAT